MLVAGAIFGSKKKGETALEKPAKPEDFPQTEADLQAIMSQVFGP